MNDIESAVREELRAEHYDLVPSQELSDRIHRRLRSRRRLRRGLTAGAALLVLGAAAGLLAAYWPNGSGPVSQPAAPPADTQRDPLASGVAGPPPATTELDGVPVRGVPAYLGPVDLAAALGSGPALSVRPSGGQQRAFTRSAQAGPVDRVVVVLGFTEPLGLVGTPVTPDWVRSGEVGNLQTLITDDSAGSTTYLMAWSPTGRRWFIAVTGKDDAARLAVLRTVATQTLPGT